MRGCDRHTSTQGMEPFRKVWNFFRDQTKLLPREANLQGDQPSKGFTVPQTGARAAPSSKRFGVGNSFALSVEGLALNFEEEPETRNTWGTF